MLPPLVNVTPQELRVVHLVAEGETNPDIATAIGTTGT